MIIKSSTATKILICLSLVVLAGCKSSGTGQEVTATPAAATTQPVTSASAQPAPAAAAPPAAFDSAPPAEKAKLEKEFRDAKGH